MNGNFISMWLTRKSVMYTHWMRGDYLFVRFCFLLVLANLHMADYISELKALCTNSSHSYKSATERHKIPSDEDHLSKAFVYFRFYNSMEPNKLSRLSSVTVSTVLAQYVEALEVERSQHIKSNV